MRIPEQCKGTSTRQDREHRDTTIFVENEQEYQNKTEQEFHTQPEWDDATVM